MIRVVPRRRKLEEDVDPSRALLCVGGDASRIRKFTQNGDVFWVMFKTVYATRM